MDRTEGRTREAAADDCDSGGLRGATVIRFGRNGASCGKKRKTAERTHTRALPKAAPNPNSAIYVKAVFGTRASMADEAAGMLVAGGALGCAVQGMRGGAEDGGRNVRLEAFFRHLSVPALRAIRRALAEAGMLAPRARALPPERIADPGWATSWKRRFEPFRIGRKFMIAPPWRRLCEPGRLGIVIQPGQAFGTGHHPTTRGALRALERLGGGRRFSPALDVGTGSGILAIAMARLGAESVLGIDDDHAAIENARVNVRLNGVARRVRLASTPLGRVKGPAGLIAANLQSSTLVALAPELKRILARGGRLVLGGILAREARAVAAHYAPGLRLIETRTDRGWTTMVFGR